MYLVFFILLLIAYSRKKREVEIAKQDEINIQNNKRLHLREIRSANKSLDKDKSSDNPMICGEDFLSKNLNL